MAPTPEQPAARRPMWWLLGLTNALVCVMFLASLRNIVRFHRIDVTDLMTFSMCLMYFFGFFGSVLVKDHVLDDGTHHVKAAKAHLAGSDLPSGKVTACCAAEDMAIILESDEEVEEAPDADVASGGGVSRAERADAELCRALREIAGGVLGRVEGHLGSCAAWSSRREVGGWTPAVRPSSSNGQVSVWRRRTADCDFAMLRGRTRSSASPAAVASLLLNDGRLGEFDDMIDSVKAVWASPAEGPEASAEDVIHRGRVAVFRFKPVWPTAPRVFLGISCAKVLESGRIVIGTTSHGVEEAFRRHRPGALDRPLSASALDGCVRGFIRISGYVLDPVDGGTDIRLIAQSDLGGSIPGAALAPLSSSAPARMLRKVQRIAAQDAARRAARDAQAPPMLRIGRASACDVVEPEVPADGAGAAAAPGLAQEETEAVAPATAAPSSVGAAPERGLLPGGSAGGAAAAAPAEAATAEAAAPPAAPVLPERTRERRSLRRLVAARLMRKRARPTAVKSA